MKTRYDGYYEKEIFYKMTRTELNTFDHLSEEAILAYIRHLGVDKAKFIIPAHAPESVTLVPFMGIALCSGDRVDTLCRMVNVDNDLYNPLVEKENPIHKNHWYSPYKIKFTPIEYDGVDETFYFSDFCSMLRDGHIKIVE